MCIFKRVFFSLISALLFSSVLTIAVRAQRMQEVFEEDLYDNVVRLHILANSDSESDQKAKYMIRDEVLGYISSLTVNADNCDEAVRILESNLGEIDKYVSETSEELGFDYDVSVHLSRERYPVRYYNGFVFPSGKYISLRIELGEAGGKNWWCVLYPSICTSPATQTAELLEKSGVSENSVRYMNSDKKYRFEFFLLDLLGF